MARDGTNRGGRRIRAGDKPEALADKIAGGRTAHIMEFPMTELDGTDLVDAADLYGEEMPTPSEFLSARQRNESRSVRMRFFVKHGCGSRSAAVSGL